MLKIRKKYFAKQLFYTNKIINNLKFYLVSIYKRKYLMHLNTFKIFPLVIFLHCVQLQLKLQWNACKRPQEPCWCYISSCCDLFMSEKRVKSLSKQKYTSETAKAHTGKIFSEEANQASTIAGLTNRIWSILY